MIDVLGHPITPGAQVLTGTYGSPAMNKVSTVISVAKKTLVVEVLKRSWHYDDATSRWVSKTEPNGRVRRRPHQVVVIDKQLEHNLMTYPENMV